MFMQYIRIGIRERIAILKIKWGWEKDIQKRGDKGGGLSYKNKGGWG